MGGRGASSGGKYGKRGLTYGSEYTTLYKSGNIKYIKYKGGSATAPLETMSKGRIYALVNDKYEIKSISYYDKHNKRYKQIDLDHPHKVDGKWIQPHTHYGYLHDEKGSKKLTPNQEKMVDRIIKTWYNRLDGK
ncbi:MAG: hypothetical protein HDT42_06295 [Ruminococcaceae bacterium]|nr:hypothetical protein [Oscillospiraceae bacterium]